MRKFMALLAALGLLAAVGTACSRDSGKPGTGGNPGGSGGGQVEDGGTLTLSMFSAPKGVFNPVLYEDAYDGKIIDKVFEGLLTRNAKLELVPRLAESYTISDDNLTVTFKLRQDVKWHDGQPFTARDVAFTFKTILHPEYTGVRASSYLDIAGAEEFQKGQAADVAGIKVLGDYEISFTTKEPYAPFLQELSFPIIPEHVFKDHPVAKLAEHPATRRPIGTGPYQFVDYKTDQYVELARFPDFFLGKPHIERVIYKIANQEIALGQVQTGEIDYLEARPEDLEVLQTQPHLTIHETPSFGYQYMGINHRHPWLGDARVRRAMMYAINRDAIVKQLLGGHGTVLHSHMPPVSWAYDAASLNPYPFEPERAKALLGEAGFTMGPDGYLQKDGRPFEVTLKFPSGNKVREKSAPLIQDNLRAVGIKVNLELMEFSTLVETVFDQNNMDLWLMGWSLSIDPDPGPIFLPNNKWGKVTGWTSARNEELIQAGVRVLKNDQRKPIYVEWAKILNDELPYVFLYTQNDIEVMNKRVRGLAPDARGMLWNSHELWIPAAER